MENTMEYDISDDDLELLADKLKALRCENKLYSVRKLTENELQTLKDIAYTLSSVLPKVSDASLFEVDDLIYPDNDLITNKPTISRTYSEDTKNRIIQSWRIPYYCVYLNTIARGRQPNTMSRILDTTFLQIIEHLPITIQDINCLLVPVQWLLKGRYENKLCQALKLLNIALDKHKEHVMGFLDDKYSTLEYIPIYIQRFQNIPKAKHQDKQQIIEWISSQVTKFLAKVEEKDIKYPYCMKHIRTFDIQKEEYFSAKFVKDMFYRRYINLDYKAYQFDLLYSFFISANTEEKKLERLRNFMIGASAREGDMNNFPAMCLESILNVTYSFEAYLKSISDLVYTDDHLRDIDKYHDYKIEPYLNNTSEIESNNEQKIENLNESQIIQNEIPDYTIDRYLFYDDLMRKLHVLNIVHTAFMMTPKIFNVRVRNMRGIDSEVFRRSFVIKEIMNEAFFNPSKDGNIPWLIETILKRCPFLIFSKNNEHMKDDLIKLLKGEKVDKILEEELFYVINATGYRE